jgi:hypothetical protein
MEADYIKQRFLQIEDYNDVIKIFKYKIMDVAYLYEKYHDIKFINDITIIKKEMNVYLQLEMQNKYKKYFPFIILLTISLSYYAINNEHPILIALIITFIFPLLLLFYIFINYNQKKVKIIIIYLNTICDKLIYTINKE